MFNILLVLVQVKRALGHCLGARARPVMRCPSVLSRGEWAASPRVLGGWRLVVVVRPEPRLSSARSVFLACVRLLLLLLIILAAEVVVVGVVKMLMYYCPIL